VHSLQGRSQPLHDPFVRLTVAGVGVGRTFFCVTQEDEFCVNDDDDDDDVVCAGAGATSLSGDSSSAAFLTSTSWTLAMMLVRGA
jgi:hypothetical protein